VKAYRLALEVRTREALPQGWATTQNNLAIALSDQAGASEGAERARLLGEAVKAYRLALEVYTREALPQDWAMTQNNLAVALSDQAGASEGAERARLLSEAVKAYRLALEVYTREALPQDWAMTQINLAIALRAQAEASEGAERARLLGEAVKAYRQALDVRTREAFPQDWAGTQSNLALALSAQAGASEGAERARLAAEAVKACRASMEVLPPSAELKIMLAQLLGQQTWFQLLAGIDSLQCGQEAVTLLDDNGPSPEWMNYAHALLYGGRYPEAEAIYRKYLGQAFADGRKWNDELRNDIAALRAAGRDHPDLKKVEAMLESAGAGLAVSKPDGAASPR